MQQTGQLLKENSPAGAKDGKHLIFQLGERGYGIPILKVSEIVNLMEITPVPKTPHYIEGVVNLRGKIIPVMDLRSKFGMEKKEYDQQTCIIIVNIAIGNEEKQMGVVVDIVSEVFDIPLSEIEAPPQYGIQEKEGFLSGIGKVKGKVIMLLNMEEVVYSEELFGLLSE